MGNGRGWVGRIGRVKIGSLGQKWEGRRDGQCTWERGDETLRFKRFDRDR